MAFSGDDEDFHGNIGVEEQRNGQTQEVIGDGRQETGGSSSLQVSKYYEKCFNVYRKMGFYISLRVPHRRAVSCIESSD